MVNIAICDDDKEFIEITEYKVRHCMENIFHAEHKISTFNNLSSLKKQLENKRTDILLLDIMVNDTNSMDWSIENIRSSHTQIIFMTSFPQSAYNISEANCCYYIVKSRMDDATLAKALKRALQGASKKDPNLTIVKTGHKNHIVNFQEIVYIETFNNNITLHLVGKDDIVMYSSLKEYAKNLPPNFLRWHLSFMINMNHVAGYEPHKFTTDTAAEVPIPPKKYNAVIKDYLSYMKNI